MRKIPVFFHIPKNAGTYVSDSMLSALRYYRRTYTDWLKSTTEEYNSIKFLQITRSGFVIAKFLIGDPSGFCKTVVNFDKKHSDIEWDIDINNLPIDLFEKVFLFGVVIEAGGFRNFRDILKIISNYDLYKFIILREPFARAQSLYNYITSASSLHEKTHSLIKSETLEDYILSSQLEDSWLIRNLTNMHDSVGVGEIHYNEACDILDSFAVYDIKDANMAVFDSFCNCYYADVKKTDLMHLEHISKNETLSKKIKLEELPDQVGCVFEARTYWDRMLYKKYCK